MAVTEKTGKVHLKRSEPCVSYIAFMTANYPCACLPHVGKILEVAYYSG
jgi:hypothetical protein